jgi:hypothetical protein
MSRYSGKEQRICRIEKERKGERNKKKRKKE